MVAFVNPDICQCCIRCRISNDHCDGCSEDHDDREIDRGDFVGLLSQMREATSLPLGEIVLAREYDGIEKEFGFGGDGPFSHSHVRVNRDYLILVPQMSVVIKVHPSGRVVRPMGATDLWSAFVIPCFWFADDEFFDEVHHAMRITAGHNVMDTIKIGGKGTSGTYPLGAGISREAMNSAIRWLLTTMAESGWFWMPALLDMYLTADPEPGFERGQVTGGIHDVHDWNR